MDGYIYFFPLFFFPFVVVTVNSSEAATMRVKTKNCGTLLWVTCSLSKSLRPSCLLVRRRWWQWWSRWGAEVGSFLPSSWACINICPGSHGESGPLFLFLFFSVFFPLPSSSSPPSCPLFWMRSGTLENIGGASRGCCCRRPPRALYICVDKIFLSYGVCTRTGVNWRESGRHWWESEKSVFLFCVFPCWRVLKGSKKTMVTLC